jgi:hypothetical protein
MRNAGFRVLILGRGNDRHVLVFWPSGRRAKIWYPIEGRVKDLDMRDLQEIVKETTGIEMLPSREKKMLTRADGHCRLPAMLGMVPGAETQRTK